MRGGISDGALVFFLLHSVHNRSNNEAGSDEEKQTDTDDHPLESVWIRV